MSQQSHLDGLVLRLIGEIHSHLLSKKKPLEILKESIENLAKASNCKYGFLGILDHQDGIKNYKYLVEKKASLNTLNLFNKSMLDSALPFKEVSKAYYFLKYTENLSEPIISYDEDRLVKGLPWSSHLLIPILFQKELIGVVGLCDKKGEFDEDYALQLQPLIDTYKLVISQIDDKVDTAPQEDSSFQESFDLMVNIDKLWNIQRGNFAWEEKLGRSKEHIMDYVFGSDYELLENIILKAKSTMTTQSEKIRFKRDKHRIFTLMVKVIYQSTTRSFKIIGKDISDRFRQESILKKQQDRLRHTQLLLQKSNNELDALIYHISHDLRAPLASALGLVFVSQQENEMEEVKSQLQLQQKSLEKMDNFISEILEFARIARTPNENVTIDIEQLIKDTVTSTSKALDVEFEVNITSNQNFPFVSDIKKVTSIAQNIIHNAFQFRSRNRFHDTNLLNISINVEENDTCIIFEDNGIGIPQEYIHRVTEIFFRAHTEYVGSGIGLYIVEQAIKRLRGHLSIISRVDQGTTFIVWLPNHYFKRELF
ncbi:sensor histidine kinase [Flammeovirga aprica]|uniref:histidine kinase n=1 Tax=Flammeovirga aprica JL-4 TaxID=694437 RepID=A0A7X9RZD4_9BACT|nr:GAF domain-containing sensor histidine kinase [Flammeovirga aprica]NME71422.1 GAF domain-containing sensor histidine kinase [Flammeovirga aprica JL-4]